ncbi:MAG: ABC transporter ATP-binding protein, partial [Oscillospiraceae bacterium]|nr:ABC transporter ATP-binding protein [Oscillospiraceae bacterium]
DVFKSVSVLSGGELSRLYLCTIMDEAVNLLILDEPTHHLDIASREWIEEAVEAYDGTLLFVSHDRYFINRFATRIWELSDGVITDYPVGFERYRRIKTELQPAEEKKAVQEKRLTEKKPKAGRGAQGAKRRLTIVERDIAAQESAIADLEAQLEAAAEDYERYAALYAEKTAAEEALEALMEQWETLAQEAME